MMSSHSSACPELPSAPSKRLTRAVTDSSAASWAGLGRPQLADDAAGLGGVSAEAGRNTRGTPPRRHPRLRPARVWLTEVAKAQGRLAWQALEAMRLFGTERHEVAPCRSVELAQPGNQVTRFVDAPDLGLSQRP